MNSLQRHLQLWLTLSLAILVGLFWFLENQSIKNITEGFLVSRLEHDADNIFSAISTEPLIQLDNQRINSTYTQPASGHYYAIRFTEGKQLTSPSIKQQELPFPSLEPGETQLTQIAGPFGQHVLLLTKGLQKGHTKLTLAIAEDLTTLKAQRQEFRRSGVQAFRRSGVQAFIQYFSNYRIISVNCSTKFCHSSLHKKTRSR